MVLNSEFIWGQTITKYDAWCEQRKVEIPLFQMKGMKSNGFFVSPHYPRESFQETSGLLQGMLPLKYWTWSKMDWMAPLFFLSDLSLQLWKISKFRALYKTAIRSETCITDTMGQERGHGTFQIIPTENKQGLPRLILSPRSLTSPSCAQQREPQGQVLKAASRSGSRVQKNTPFITILHTLVSYVHTRKFPMLT